MAMITVDARHNGLYGLSNGHGLTDCRVQPACDRVAGLPPSMLATLEPSPMLSRAHYEETPPAITPGFSFETITEKWFVAHVKHQEEKHFAWDMLALGIPHFLPMLPMIRQSNGRRRTVDRVIFPGYVFIAGGDDVISAARDTRKMLDFLRVLNQHKLIREMSDIQKATESGELAEKFVPLSKGQKCRVIHGPWKNYSAVAVIEEMTTKGYAVLEMTVLGSPRSVEIPLDFLEPI